MDIIVMRIIECIGPRHGAKKELAEHLGIHPNVITNWLNGRLMSYKKYLPQIAEFYGVSKEWLEGADVPKNKKSAEEISADDLQASYLRLAKSFQDDKIDVADITLALETIKKLREKK